MLCGALLPAHACQTECVYADSMLAARPAAQYSHCSNVKDVMRPEPTLVSSVLEMGMQSVLIVVLVHTESWRIATANHIYTRGLHTMHAH